MISQASKIDRLSLLTLLSGIFLGLTVFTKIPAITIFLPLVGFLIYDNFHGKIIYYSRRKKLKNLGLWLVPVILIPLIWPIYAVSAGELENWLNGLTWQATERPDRPIWNSLSDIFKFDPVLFVLGISAIVYVAVRKRDRLGYLVGCTVYSVLLLCRPFKGYPLDSYNSRILYCRGCIDCRFIK